MNSDALLQSNTSVYITRYNGTHYCGERNVRHYLSLTLPRTLKGRTNRTEKLYSHYITSNGYKYILPLNLLRNGL